MKRRFGSLLLTLILSVSIASIAQAEEVTLDKVIVSARGSASSQSQTPGGTGVVEKEDIILAPTASIANSISRISGLTKTGDSPWGQDVSIRGLTGSSVVVLIDGMRLNTATEINARLGFINPMDVERVEVLKGPVSSLYGSGSTGGVINIITKKGKFTPENDISGEAILNWSTNPQGPDGYGRAVLSLKDLWIQASVGIRDHDSFHGGDSTRISNSQYEDVYLRIAGEKKWTDLLSTRFQAMNIEADNVGIPGGSATMPQNAAITYPRSKNSLVSLDTVFTPRSDVVKEVLFNLYYMKNDRRVRIDKPAPPVDYVSPMADHETFGGKIQGEFGLGNHNIVAGFDAWNWHIVSERAKHMVSGAVKRDKPTPTSTMLSMGVFAEDNWRLNEAFTLNLGARLDRIEVSNKANATYDKETEEDLGWNLHTGLTWTPAKHWSHTIIAASSYRAADILERFKNINLAPGVISRGNPNLDPETSYYLEYGLHYTTNTLSVTGSAYINYINNYIEEKQKNAALYEMENVGEARIYGLEMDADWRFSEHWNLYGNIAFANGRDLENEEALRSVAPVNGLSGIRYTMGNGFWARLETPWALRQSEVPNGTARSDGWITCNTAAGYDFKMGKTDNSVSLSVNNIFDKKYQNYLANSRGVELLEPGISAAINYQIAF